VSATKPAGNATQIQGTFSWRCGSPDLQSSRQCCERSAWVLISPAGTFLSSLNPSPAWTNDPCEAMSWLDPAVASSLLALALPSAGVLKLMTFRADASSFPYRWMADGS
jgi:hypothetical protein